MRRAIGVMVSAVALAASAAAVATGASVPTLGRAGVEGSATRGFGVVRPSQVNYGGDPTSFVSGVHWSSWGGAKAVGHGRAYWVWPGWCVACASVELPATVVAFDRTECDGQSVYARVEWYFPSRGMTFSATLTDQNLCTGKSPTTSAHFPHCSSFTLAGSNRRIEYIYVSAGERCATVRRFIESLPVARDYGHNAKFTEPGGWFCGTQRQTIVAGLQSFGCERGDEVSISFSAR